MSKPQGAAYKRSWKNLLINKRYQLRFTLVMVGLSTLLMAGLGVWVMRVADETTAVAMASVRGTPCPKIPQITEGTVEEPVDPVPMKLDEPGEPPAPVPAPTPAPTEPAAGSADADADADATEADATEVDGEDADADATEDDGEDAPRRATVVVDESSMTMVPVAPKVPADLGPKIVAHWTCEMKLTGKIAALERGRELILWVLIGTGLLLVFGLAIYGIKMTHRVAGPLFKVSLYLAKMRDGRLDKVWNLRKGDQLVDFYEHFKTAHAGVVQMEQDDIAKIKSVIAAAEAAGAGEHASVVELRELLARKEKAIE